ncbi:MAG: hypothetical protein JWO53_650 [Chlamydiia bacterium]|nr:hypothetical protein [Chlamydiia bacterium]
MSSLSTIIDVSRQPSQEAQKQKSSTRVSTRSVAGRRVLAAIATPPSATATVAERVLPEVSQSRADTSPLLRSDGTTRKIQKSYWQQGILRGIYYLFQYIFVLDFTKYCVMREIYKEVHSAIKRNEVIDASEFATALLESTKFKDKGAIFRLMTENFGMVQHALGNSLLADDLFICLRTHSISDKEIQETIRRLLTHFRKLDTDNFEEFANFVKADHATLESFVTNDRSRSILGVTSYRKLKAMLAVTKEVKAKSKTKKSKSKSKSPVIKYDEQNTKAIHKIIAQFMKAPLTTLTKENNKRFFNDFEREIGGAVWKVAPGQGPGRVVAKACDTGFAILAAYLEDDRMKLLADELVYWVAIAYQPNVASDWSEDDLTYYTEALGERFKPEEIRSAIQARRDDFEGMYGVPNLKMLENSLKIS